MAASVSIRVYTGASAGTESASVTAIALLSIDAPTNDPDDHKVAKGANSFEKWVRIKIDAANGSSATNFWVERSGALPDGVVIRMGVTDSAATPTAATSTVATTAMAAGRRYTFDANVLDADNDTTRYLVIQEQVAASAVSGKITQQTFRFGYSE